MTKREKYILRRKKTGANVGIVPLFKLCVQIDYVERKRGAELIFYQTTNKRISKTVAFFLEDAKHAP